MGVAKAGLESCAPVSRRNLGDKKVRVNLVAAGPLRTMAAKSIPGFVFQDVSSGRRSAGTSPALSPSRAPGAAVRLVPATHRRSCTSTAASTRRGPDDRVRPHPLLPQRVGSCTRSRHTCTRRAGHDRRSRPPPAWRWNARDPPGPPSPAGRRRRWPIITADAGGRHPAARGGRRPGGQGLHQIASQFQSSVGLSGKPGVTIQDSPFLPQLISRDFHTVNITASNARPVAGSGLLKAASLNATLHGISTFTGSTARRSISSAPRR